MGLDDLLIGVARGAGWSLGVATVAGVAVLAGKGARPLAKRAMVGYLLLADRVRELTAEATEQLQDIYAEAQAELAERGLSEAGDAEDLQTPAPSRRRARRSPRAEGA
jgi:Protein of unknown function (DUF5132)